LEINLCICYTVLFAAKVLLYITSQVQAQKQRKRAIYITSRSSNSEISKRWTAGRLVEDEAFILSDLKMSSHDRHSSDIHMYSRMTP